MIAMMTPIAPTASAVLSVVGLSVTVVAVEATEITVVVVCCACTTVVVAAWTTVVVTGASMIVVVVLAKTVVVTPLTLLVLVVPFIWKLAVAVMAVAEALGAQLEVIVYAPAG